MRNNIGRLFLAAGTAATLIAMPLATRAAAISAPSVVISEIGWAGSSLSTVDEWLELTNLTDDAVDLSGWTVTGAATSNGSLTIPVGASIPSHSTFLISNYDRDNAKSTLARAPDLVTSSVSLSNSALSLGLVDAGGTIRDVAGSGGAPLAGRTGGGNESPGAGPASMVRLSPVADGALAASWTAATQSVGFDFGATELGTPGAIESWFVEAAAEDPEELEGSVEAVETMETDVTPLFVSPPSSKEGAEVVIDVAPVTVDEQAPIESIGENTEPDTTPMDTIVESSVETVAIERIVETNAAGTTPIPSLDEGGETLEISVDENAEPTPADIVEEPVEIEQPVEIQAVAISATPYGTLLVNEFVSDATDEWIEILNPFNNLIDLSGWTVRDATAKATALPDQLLGLGQFVVVTNPSGKLNNDGDTIELVDPNGSVVDAVTYGSGAESIPKKQNALARDSGGIWNVTTTLTPGAENLFDAVETAVVESVETVAAQIVSPTEFPSPSQGEGQGEVPVTAAVTPIATTEPPSIEPVIAETIAEQPINLTTLLLTQIYPNATGDDAAEEFIAVTNVGDETVDLKDWSIADATGKTFSPDESTPVEPGATLVLSRATTKIVLNNTSDTVTLSAPDGTLIDSISYDSARIGSILRLQGSDWVWSGNATGAKPGAVQTDVAPAPSAAVAAAPPSRVSAGRSKITGTVLVEPGVLGKQIFYVDNGDGGIQVYKNDADFPDLKEGDVVTVTGTVTESRGEERLKVGKTDSIAVVSSAEPEVAESITVADIDESDHGKLVRVAGIVLMRSGSRITLEDHGAQIAVRVADGTGIDPTTFVRGDSVEVTGILIAAGVTLTLLPRSPDDVTVVPATQTVDASAATIASGKAARAAGDQTTATLITLGTLLSLGLYAGRKLIPSWNLYAKTRALRLAASAAR